MLGKIFNIYTLILAVVVGVGCWFLVDYVDPFSIESALMETVKIFAMLAVFACCFFAALCVLVLPFKGLMRSR